jgi:hypothetical protein
MGTDSKNIFVRNRKKTIAAIVLLLTLASGTATELLLRRLMGLGNPVIYDSNPLYGYRPLPNRQYKRFQGAEIRFNNLGLRAETDFDPDPSDKILFLGDSVTYGGSRVGNRDLFSHLAVEGLGNFKSGNAGVNAWGVENIHGLVVEHGFRPARISVTVLAEEDFYRGLVQCQGMPFFNNAPRLALSELWYFFCTVQARKKHRDWRFYASETEVRRVVEKAARKLKEVDDVLHREGGQHLLFITPSRKQVLGDEPKDPLVLEALQKYGLTAVYIVDWLASYNFSDREKASLFYDAVHLRKAGHKVWAQVIRDELAERISVEQRPVRRLAPGSVGLGSSVGPPRADHRHYSTLTASTSISKSNSSRQTSFSATITGNDGSPSASRYRASKGASSARLK